MMGSRLVGFATIGGAIGDSNHDGHRAQVHNYLKATSFRLGLLVNFGQYPRLQYERIVK